MPNISDMRRAILKCWILVVFCFPLSVYQHGILQLHLSKLNLATFKCHPLFAGLCVPPFVLGNLLIQWWGEAVKCLSKLSKEYGPLCYCVVQ